MLDLHRNFTSQIQYMLRRYVSRLLNNHREIRNYSSADLQRLAKEDYVDEINVMDKDGVVIASSTAEKVRPDQPVRKKITVTKEVATSKLLMAEEGFHTTYQQRKGDSYSVIMPFNDGSGYLEVVMKKERVFKEYDMLIVPLLKNRLIGREGFTLIIDSEGNIVLSSLHQEQLMGKKLSEFCVTADCMNAPEQIPFIMKFNGRWYVSMR